MQCPIYFVGKVALRQEECHTLMIFLLVRFQHCIAKISDKIENALTFSLENG